jgi:hypothetical protein
MTVEADLFNALKGLVSNRVYPDVAPANATKPYLTYQQVGGVGVNFIDTSVPSKKNARFQINVWAQTRGAAAILARQVEDALRSTTSLQTTVLGAPVADYEEDTQLYGTRQDFSFWHTS